MKFVKVKKPNNDFRTGFYWFKTNGRKRALGFSLPQIELDLRFFWNI